MHAPDARRLLIAGTLAVACTRSAAPPPEPHTEPPPDLVEPPAEPEFEPPPPPPAPPSRPGELTGLWIGEGWGCVVDVAGDLWCWGHGPEPAPPWQAVRVETPGPVVALASDREPMYPPSYVTCATFQEADARCWEHGWPGRRGTWGPFAGTAGALDVAVHARSSGTGTNFVCVRMPGDTAPCFLSFVEEAPEQTLRDILDLDHLGRMVALTRGGRVLDLLAPVGNYGQVALRSDRTLGRIPGARELVTTPYTGPLCAIDGQAALRCTDKPRRADPRLAALRAIPGPVRSAGLETRHGCLVTEAGAVACAGRNRWGELGSGEALTETPRLTAAVIPGLDGARAVAVTGEQTCVMTATRVRCYGRNGAIDVRDQQSTLDLDARRILLRHHRTCIVDSADRTWCWGDGVEGTGPRRIHLPIGAPIAIAGPVGECFVDERRAILCGALIPDPDHPGDLRISGDAKPRTIAAIGRGGDYAEHVRGKLRLRDREFADPILPAPITDLAGGWDRINVLASSGELRSWHRDEGPWGAHLEQRVVPITDAIALSGNCALRSGGRVSCWSGSSVDDTTITDAQRIVASGDQVCAILPDNRLRCEAFGPHFIDPPAVPVTDDVADLAAGTGHWCAIVKGGKVVCWGANRLGQLGTLPANVSLEGRDIAWGGP